MSEYIYLEFQIRDFSKVNDSLGRIKNTFFTKEKLKDYSPDLWVVSNGQIFDSIDGLPVIESNLVQKNNIRLRGRKCSRTQGHLEDLIMRI